MNKRLAELRSVQLLEDAKGLGLTNIRNASKDPPDVEAMRGRKTIGIEVTEAIESDAASLHPPFKDLIVPEVKRLAASAGPGEAFLHCQGLALPRNRKQRLELAAQIAEVVLSLAARARQPGDRVAVARQISSGGIQGSRIVFYDDIRLPIPLGIVDFTRNESGPLDVVYTGGSGPFVHGSGLETTEACVEKKAAGLARWAARYDEHWLLVTAFRYSSTSVDQARRATTRLHGTGFDQIWLIDASHTPGDSRSPGCDAIRLDRP